MIGAKIENRQFYKAIREFTGASRRLETLARTEQVAVFKDFAHSPSKLKATVNAVKAQFPERKLVACMELHTFSSLTEDFLPQYAACMDQADVAFVYYNPKVVEHKKLKNIDPEEVKKAFGGDNITVFTDSQLLQQKLKTLDYSQSAILFMTSGNFSGLDIQSFSKELMEQNK